MHTETFNFDTLPDRNGTGCAKWNRRTEAEKAAGIVPMSIADMEFPCAPCIAGAVMKAARHGVFGYTDADDAYYEAVAGWMEHRHGWRVEPEWIVPENGIVPAMTVAVRAFTQPGDSVLIQSPGYYPFTLMTEINDRKPVFSPLRLGDDGLYHMDLEDLRKKAADPRVKLMFLCSPHNPVGRVWTVDELGAVGEICAEHGILLVSDEIHFDLILSGKHHPFIKAVPAMRDQAIVLTAPSKTFNLAGLQLANTIIPNARLREQYRARKRADGYSNISYFGYHATIAAYAKGEAWLEALLTYVRGNFAFLDMWLRENLPMVRLLPGQGTYLAWTDWRALGMTDAELQRFVRRDAMLFLDEGTMFGEGGEGFMRFNLALPRPVLEQSLERLLDAAKRKKII